MIPLEILKPAQSYKRLLSIRGDHSSILSSGYLLYTVKVIYSKDIFYTDDEMFAMFNKKINVQSVVEQPQIYIVAQCDDSIEEKLAYVPVRGEDMAELAQTITVDNIKIDDEMRYFIGSYY